MSEYCKRWVADPRGSPPRLTMTAHKPSPPAEDTDITTFPPPSPSLSSSNSAEADDDDDDDDRLSLSSGDLDASWLEVGPPRSMVDSLTASAFGSSTISDMAISDRASEPSERGDETDGWALSSDAGSELHTDAEAHSADEAEDNLETPSLTRTSRLNYNDKDVPETEAFQRSFIFPDPHSPSQSFSSSWTSTTTNATVKDDTPHRSLSNIRTESWGDTKIPTTTPVIPRETKAVNTSTPSPPPTIEAVTPKAESFRPPPPASGRRWPMMAYVFALSVLFLEIGFNPDIGGMISSRFAPNATPEVTPVAPPTARTWLEKLEGTDLQVVRDAITALSTDSRKDVVPTQPTDIPWATVIRKKAEAVTDLITTPQVKSVSVVEKRATCNCPPQQECTCPPLSEAAKFVQHAIILFDDYARWTSQVIQALYVSTYDYLAEETEIVKRQLQHYKEVIAQLVGPKPLETAVENALIATAATHVAVNNAYVHIHETVCGDGRCDRAAVNARIAARNAAKNARHAATAAQKRAGDTAIRARRGLDNAIKAGRGVLDTAAAEAAARYNSWEATEKTKADLKAKADAKTKANARMKLKANLKEFRRRRTHKSKVKCKSKSKPQAKKHAKCGFRFRRVRANSKPY